jgi:hypothetical protein
VPTQAAPTVAPGRFPKGRNAPSQKKCKSAALTKLNHGGIEKPNSKKARKPAAHGRKMVRAVEIKDGTARR